MTGSQREIITALSKTPKLFVIALNSTFTYKGKPVKVQQVGRELGVKYVLEGSVRKAGDKVRITAQLVDARTGHHIWAERYDRELKDIFAIQDEITKKIITSVHVKLTEGEQGHLYAKGTANLDAYLKASEASWYLRQSTKEDLLKAKQLAEDAIALDPNYPPAYSTLGMFYGISIWLGMSKSPADSLSAQLSYLKRPLPWTIFCRRPCSIGLLAYHGQAVWTRPLPKENEQWLLNLVRLTLFKTMQ